MNAPTDVRPPRLLVPSAYTDSRLAYALLGPLNAKRATGWRPGARTDWGAMPGDVDCLGRPIDPNAPRPTTEPMDIDTHVDAWLAAHKETKTESPLAVPTTPGEATTMTANT